MFVKTFRKRNTVLNSNGSCQRNRNLLCRQRPRHRVRLHPVKIHAIEVQSTTVSVKPQPEDAITYVTLTTKKKNTFVNCSYLLVCVMIYCRANVHRTQIQDQATVHGDQLSGVQVLR